MKKIITSLFALICFVLFATPLFAGNEALLKKSDSKKNWGLGIRFGDPLSITAKKYMGNNRALEFCIGRPAGFGYNDGYYNNRFVRIDKYKGYYYGGFNQKNSLALSASYLIHKDIKDLEGLQWYYGFGAMLRWWSYEYRYYDKIGYYSETVSDIDFGATGHLGLEYGFKEVPLSVFLDAGVFLEIYDSFYFHGIGGIGIRYNF